MPLCIEPVYIGIDPGSSGGMVALWGNCIQSTPLRGMNKYDIRDWVEDKRDWGDGCFACIERVGGFIGREDSEGRKRNVSAAHKTFVLGESFGMLDMSLVCARITRKDVLPKVWQAYIGIKRNKGEDKGYWKNRLKERAQSLFPSERITLAIADAFLLAYYCKGIKWQ